MIVFFVISGFLVGGRTILNLHDKGFGIIDYLVHRFSRIYTVLILALIVRFILDRLGIEFSMRQESITIRINSILTHSATT